MDKQPSCLNEIPKYEFDDTCLCGRHLRIGMNYPIRIIDVQEMVMRQLEADENAPEVYMFCKKVLSITDSMIEEYKRRMKQ